MWIVAEMPIRGFNPKQYLDKNWAKAIFFLLHKENFEQQLKKTEKRFPRKGWMPVHLLLLLY